MALIQSFIDFTQGLGAACMMPIFVFLIGLVVRVPFKELLVPMVVTFGAAGLFVGVIGSWTSIRKFMDV